MKVFLFVLSFLFAFRLSTQAQSSGSWNVINLSYSINPKWSLFGEGQLRSLRFYDDFHYFEYKGGINYNGNKSIRLSLGAGSYQTYKEGGSFVRPKNNDEFRLWPQVLLFQNIGMVKIEQRYRTEMRFTSNGYRNRFRYRLGVSVPFGKIQNDCRPFQLSLSNEIFFTDREPYFERNRLLLSVQYRLAESVSFQLGYLYQFDYRINDETGRNFLVAGLYIDLFRKNESAAASDLEIQNN